MEEDRETEDEIARKKLGPQGVPGKDDTHGKKPETKDSELPQTGRFDDGHVK